MPFLNFNGLFIFILAIISPITDFTPLAAIHVFTSNSRKKLFFRRYIRYLRTIIIRFAR